MVRGALVAAAAFAAMEPVSYAAHRWVMHGAGWALHQSHHRTPVGPVADAGQPGSRTGRWRSQLEANDVFPVLFAGATIVGMALGTRVRALRPLVPAGLGVTAYGAAYAVVHDLYTHQRFTRMPRRAPLEGLEGLARAHARHHLDGGEPYGMLLPVVRQRSAGSGDVVADLHHHGLTLEELERLRAGLVES